MGNDWTRGGWALALAGVMACGSSNEPAPKDGGDPVRDARAPDAAGDGDAAEAGVDSGRPDPTADAGDGRRDGGGEDADGPDGMDAGGGQPVGPCTPGADYPDSPLPVASPQAQKVIDGFHFLEGPVWLAEQGVLLFSDMQAGDPENDHVQPAHIHQLTPPSNVTLWKANSGSNGLAVDPAGDVVAATHDTRSVSRYDAETRARSSIADVWEGKRFASPNDVVVAADGSVFFSDPAWQLGEREREIAMDGVYRVDPDGGVHRVYVDPDAARGGPNGVALSPDETTLYVAYDKNDGQGRILRFALDDDLNATPVADLVSGISIPDGLVVDCAGNLYAALKEGVGIYDAQGDGLGTVSVPSRPTNVSFGGTDRRTLYITTGDGALYETTLAIPGLP